MRAGRAGAVRGELGGLYVGCCCRFRHRRLASLLAVSLRAGRARASRACSGGRARTEAAARAQAPRTRPRAFRGGYRLRGSCRGMQPRQGVRRGGPPPSQQGRTWRQRGDARQRQKSLVVLPLVPPPRTSPPPPPLLLLLLWPQLLCARCVRRSWLGRGVLLRLSARVARRR